MFHFCHSSGQPDLEDYGVGALLCYILHHGDGICQTWRPFAFPAQLYDQNQTYLWYPKAERFLIYKNQDIYLHYPCVSNSYCKILKTWEVRSLKKMQKFFPRLLSLTFGGCTEWKKSSCGSGTWIESSILCILSILVQFNDEMKPSNPQNHIPISETKSKNGVQENSPLRLLISTICLPT